VTNNLNHLLGAISTAAFVSTVVIAIVTARETFRFHSMEWDELLKQLRPIDSAQLQMVANNHLNPTKGQTRMQRYAMWLLIGGEEGLSTMRHNAQVILALADYARRWNYEEAVIVGERIRREALSIRRAVSKVTRYGFVNPMLRVEGPFYLSEVAAAYYLMRARLLALYETSHVGLHSRLAAALRGVNEEEISSGG
jgi:hypothetical protein